MNELPRPKATACRIAKLFRNGRSQAVRLPAEFHFEGTEVSIRRDAASGEVILSSKSTDRDGFWREFLAMVAENPAPDNFLTDRDRALPQDREWF